MNSTQENIGILGYGLYLPDSYMSAQDISSATGGVWSEQAVVEKASNSRQT